MPSLGPITTYLPQADIAALRLRAAEADRTLAAEVRRAVNKHLNTSEAALGESGSARATTRGNSARHGSEE